MVRYFENKKMPFKLGSYLAKNQDQAMELTKIQANATAKAYRNLGYNARITKDRDGYSVWHSQNMASFYRMPKKGTKGRSK